MHNSKDFSMDLIIDGTQATIWISGDIDMSSSNQLTELGTTTARTAALAALVFDMSAVTFLDSTGLEAMIRIRDVANDHSVDLRLRGVPTHVRKVLVLCGLDAVFQIVGGDLGRC